MAGWIAANYGVGVDERLQQLYRRMVAVAQGQAQYETVRMSHDSLLENSSGGTDELLAMMALHGADSILGRLPEWWAQLASHTMPCCTYAGALSMMHDEVR